MNGLLSKSLKMERADTFHVLTRTTFSHFPLIETRFKL